MFDSKLAFILWWVKVEAYFRKSAVYQMFSYTELKQHNSNMLTGEICLLDNKPTVVDENLNPIEIPKNIFDRDEKKMTSWFRSDEVIKLNKGDLPNIHAPVTTTYGELFCNVILLIAPLGPKAHLTNYVSKEDHWVTSNDFTNAVLNLPRNKPPEPPKENEVEPNDVWRCLQAKSWIEAFNPIFTPAATKETMAVPKEVLLLRDRLMKDAFERGLNKDAVHMAGVEKQIMTLDRELMKGKPGAMFLMDNDEAYDVCRKRMYITYGVEGSIEGSDVVETIQQPLADGLDLNHLPEQANTMRGGIAGRGLSTALAGADAKNDSRVGQNSSFNEEDCKSPVGLEMLIQPSMVKGLEGRYLLGSNKPITKEEASRYLWKKISLRDPSRCKANNPNYCKICSGDKASVMENSVALQMMQKDNAIMYQTAMGAMHGAALKTTKYDLMDRLH